MNKLKSYKKRIDVIDKKIVNLLSLRFNLAKWVSSYKKKNKIEITDKKREVQVLNNIKKNSNKKHQKFMVDIFRNIIDYSKRMQK